MKNQINKLGFCSFVLLMGLLASCSVADPALVKPTSEVPSAVSASRFLPIDAFKGTAQAKATEINFPNAASDNILQKITGKTVVLAPMVWLYSSPTSKRYYATSNVDFKVNIRLWEIFLKKYNVPYKVVLTPEKLEASAPGVLILPSLVALSEKEKVAIAKFRAQGGSVLSSWLTGVRNDDGTWQGFSFMKDVLDVQVVGDTENEEEENFLVSNGDGAITHSLPAGQRVWLERVKGIYPLRLLGQQTAAQIMNWSRAATRNKTGASIVFGEHRQPSGVLSRSVVLGYAERLWLSADPKAMEAIAHNALTWLLRQPDSHLASWPFPYTEALSIAIDAPEVVDELDVKFAEWIEKSGGRASYYILSANAAKSADALKALQLKGHEIGYMADRFEGFQDQRRDVQSKRLTTMQQEFLAAGLLAGLDRGLHTPVESQDGTTLSLINQLGFTHVVAFMDVTEGRVPLLVPRVDGNSGVTKPLVILPRTQSGPEDLMGEGDPDEGLKQYFAEFESSIAMGGLSLIRFPNQTLLTEDQIKAVFDQFKQHSVQTWQAPNGDIARWWIDRERINVDMDTANGKARLSVKISPGAPLTQAAAVIMNLPYANGILKLVAQDAGSPTVKISQLDPWRVAVSLGGLQPGTHRWLVQFEHSGPGGSK